MRILLFLPILLILGCTTGRNVKLDPKWAPLSSVEEGKDKLFTEGMITTIGHHCYVTSMKDWLAAYPEGSVEREALLRHEQVHAKRELAAGLPIWLTQYITDKNFRWYEEQLGFEQEIRYLVKNGRLFNIANFAAGVSREYESLGGQMCNHQEAVDWATQLLNKIAQGE